jgi:hypothetical protein
LDDIARWAASDRADLCRAAAARRNVDPQIVEKDFWVCWTLKRLFTLDDPPARLLFKGGTSLSKAYGVIERFSEDADLSFFREDLGFKDERDPATAESGKQAKELLEDLKEECQRMIRDKLLPLLTLTFEQHLGTPPSPGTWQVVPDDQDPDLQSLVFNYPPGLGQSGGASPQYLRPLVRLEMGARGDHWPMEVRTISPYAAEALPDQFRESGCQVRVLAAARTFCEKLTILHGWCHAGPDRQLRDRLSRHYYDVARLWESGIGRDALNDGGDLLRKVARHHAIFFKTGWARYHEAVPGSLRLVPPAERRTSLEADYRQMREMFFKDPPSFAEIVRVLTEIELAVNGSG